jgi:hypothetical protein
MDIQASKPAQSIYPKILGYSAVVTLIVSISCFVVYWRSDGRIQRNAISTASEDWNSQAMNELLKSVQFEYVFDRNDTEAYIPLNWTNREDVEYVERMWNDPEEPLKTYPVSYHAAKANLSAVFPDFRENPLLRFYMNAQKACLTINWSTSPNSSTLLKGLEPCIASASGYQTGLEVQYWRHMRVPLECSSGKECTGKCMMEGGNWVGLDSRGSCYRYMIIDRICVKTVPVRVSTDEEVWAYDGGCFASGHFARYTPVSSIHIYNFTSFPLEIRHSKDPVVVAFNVSSDRIVLAPSAYHYAYWAAVTQVLAIALDFFAVCLHRSYKQKEESYREQVDVMASLPE